MTVDAWSEVALPLLTGQEGVATSAQLRERGVRAPTLSAWVADGRLVRLRRNVLVDGQRWQESPPWERHRLRAHGVMVAWSGVEVALSHQSALAVLDLSIYGTDDLVHVVGVGPRRWKARTGVVQHAGVAPGRLVRVDGVPCVRPEVACLQVASTFGVEAGLVAADSALREGACNRGDLEGLRGWSALGRGRPAAGVVVDRADGRHESAGESRTGWLLHRLGLVAVPQVRITDERGGFVARVDFLLERDRVVVEFDGLAKYGQAGDLAAEKLREDRLRELGYEVVRLTWADLDRPDVVREKVEAACRRARARRTAGSR